MTAPTLAQEAATYSGMPVLGYPSVIAYIHVARSDPAYPPLLVRLPDGRYAVVSIHAGRVRVSIRSTPACPKPFCIYHAILPGEHVQ